MKIYKDLQDVSSTVIAECFNEAFADYPIRMEMNAQTIDGLFQKDNVDRSLSFGAFEDNDMIGFIFNSHAEYDGKNAVFDVGTAVVPSYRNQHVFSGLFAYAVKRIRERSIDRYYLEVLCENKDAIRIYKKKGFKITRKMAVYAADKNCRDIDRTFKMIGLDHSDILYKCPKINVRPSFEHSDSVLMQNPDLYQTIYDDTRGFNYCVFDKNKGHIVRMGYDDQDIMIGILTTLVSKYPGMIVKNIGVEYHQLIGILEMIGFSKIAEQYEMCKEIISS